jgi:hypothetical protein
MSRSAAAKRSPIPVELSPFVSKAKWDRLALHELEANDRRIVLNILEDGFRAADPKKADPKDIADALSIARKLADDFRVKFDSTGYDAHELAVAVNIAEEVSHEAKRKGTKRAKGSR